MKTRTNRKKILFVINTLGRGGAESALIELMKRFEPKKYEVSVFVLLGQGELVRKLPKYVKLLNHDYCNLDVLSKKGGRAMHRRIIRQVFQRKAVFHNAGSILKNAVHMLRNRKLMPDKLLWRSLSDGAEQFSEQYDLAVAFLEGGSTYYVADHVNARKKVAFVHIAYERAGYTRAMDRDCYQKFDRIFHVSEETRESFLNYYPEMEKKSYVFHNLLNQEEIRRKSRASVDFGDDFDGIRLLSVGRLVPQKAYDVSIEAMRLLKQDGISIRWYVLGEGEERANLERQIKKEHLTEDFRLLGVKSNPYPYFRACDIYVHTSRFEGKSIAIQEAQILGCTILASDCSGNREQIQNGRDGILCKLSAKAIHDAVLYLLHNPNKCKKMQKEASKKVKTDDKEINLLLELLGA